MQESLLKKIRLVPVVVALLVSVVVWWNVWATQEQTVLVYSTGSKVGLYHRLAVQMKTVVETRHPDIVIELRKSAGSNENIQRLDDGHAHLALVQNDAIGGGSVRSVASLYPEVLHLVCRTDAKINSLEDLVGHRIGVGASGSGTEQIATRLLQFVGVEPKPEPFWRGAFGEAIEGLKAGEIDAAFLLIGLGGDVVSDAMRDEQLKLAPIQMRSVEGENPEDIAKTAYYAMGVDDIVQDGPERGPAPILTDGAPLFDLF